MTEPRIREIGAGEVGTASELVTSVFAQAVAPSYAPPGRDTFLAYASAAAMAARLDTGHRLLVAEIGGELVGVLETRGDDHVSLLFVTARCQRRGIGRSLLSAAVARGMLTGDEEITVNASPDSVAAYQRLGFIVSGTEQEKSGIRFVPMFRPGSVRPGS